MSRGKIVGDGPGQYKIGQSLGKGAFSTVYDCVRLLDGMRFAIKVISKNDMRRDPELEDALCREINSMETIRHSEFITNMVDKLVSPRNYYIVMDLVCGGNLMQLIQKSHTGLHPNRARLYFRQLLLGLTAMHGSNVVHRDIKPENLLLDETKTVLKVSDFGFACYSQPERELKRKCGTVRFTAPELYMQDSYYGRDVDIWAAGVTLYVMLFNAYPFGTRSDDSVNVIEKIMAGKFQFPRRLSTPLEHLLCAMLRTDPKKRLSLEQIKSHAWVLGIDELTITIPRRRISGATAGQQRRGSRPTPGGSTSSPASAAADNGPAPSKHPASAVLSPCSSNPSEHSISPATFPCVPSTNQSTTLGGSLQEETTADQSFVLRSTLLLSDEAEEENDEEYVAGGLHRRVRSCPVLPTIFFSTVTNGRSISNGGENIAAATTTTAGLVSLRKRSALDMLPVDSTQAGGGTNSEQQQQQLEESIRQEDRLVERALRLSELPHSVYSAVGNTDAFSSWTRGNHFRNVADVSPTLGGCSSALFTPTQMRDAFYSDLPSRIAVLQPRSAAAAATAAPYAPPLSPASASVVGAGTADGTSQVSPPHVPTLRFNNARRGSQQSTPSVALIDLIPGGGGGGDGGSLASHRSSSSKESHSNSPPSVGVAGFVKREGSQPMGSVDPAAASSSGHPDDEKRFIKAPLWKRLSTAHVRIFVNFCVFCLTLLVVGALRVLFDVDARKLRLPRFLKDLLERVLAPPFEREGDSLGTTDSSATDEEGSMTSSQRDAAANVAAAAHAKSQRAQKRSETLGGKSPPISPDASASISPPSSSVISPPFALQPIASTLRQRRKPPLPPPQSCLLPITHAKDLFSDGGEGDDSNNKKTTKVDLLENSPSKRRVRIAPLPSSPNTSEGETAPHLSGVAVGTPPYRDGVKSSAALNWSSIIPPATTQLTDDQPPVSASPPAKPSTPPYNAIHAGLKPVKDLLTSAVAVKDNEHDLCPPRASDPTTVYEPEESDSPHSALHGKGIRVVASHHELDSYLDLEDELI